MRNNQRRDTGTFSIPNKLTRPQTLTALTTIATTANKELINEAIYKGTVQRNGVKSHTVRAILRSIFHNKCAYCEDTTYKPEVEHYRPKGSVKEDSTHPGYYWLCYEWTNLLPACHSCNTDGGKGTKFPIAGTRVTSPTINIGVLNTADNKANAPTLIAEKPYLLHPEIDTPDDGSYFVFDYTGKITGIDTGNRGSSTIEICNLNRDDLLERRRERVIMPLVKQLRILLKLNYHNYFVSSNAFLKALDLVFEEFLEESQPTKAFSLLALYIQSDFSKMIAEPAGETPEQELFLKKAFEEFMKRK